MKKTGVDYVKEESREYLEALSQAGYIIGNMVLPGFFVKKETQVYFNPMLEIYDMKSVETAEFLSVTARELLKTDYICAPSKSKAKEAWLEKCTLGKVYDGKVIIEKKEGLKEGRGSLLECIRSQNAVPGMEFFSLEIRGKKESPDFRAGKPGGRLSLLSESLQTVWTGKNMIRLFIVAGLEAGEM